MSRDQPNIVCIVADDLGWRDLGCYGSSFYETPALDRLARDGTLFTDAYAAAPVCSPTRASVMSGKYPARVGITNWIGGNARGKLLPPEYCHRLPETEISLAAVLSDAGYETCHVGKWHLGDEEQNADPEEHGFDINVGGCSWGSPKNGYFDPWGIPTLEEGPEDEGRYLPDRLGEEAVAIVEEYANGDDPFFLHYAPYLVHTPLQAPEESVEYYERKRQRLGLDEVTEVQINGRFPAEHKKDQRIERRLVQSHPTYAAMVEALDRNVGRVLDALERTGQAEDTVIVFTSDNGGLTTAEGSPTTNRPLREGKGWMEEGGNRVPFLVRWPGASDHPDAPDLCETPVTSPDVYPTLLSAGGVSVPENQAVDGVDLRPLFDGTDLDREEIFWHYPHYGNQGGTPASAVRVGDWKLVEFFEDDHVELYHLGEDVREACDLAAHRPNEVADLHDRLREWREDVGAKLPAENPDYEPWPDRAGFD
ncbi:sulfatase [Halomontanus rarus]|uniref:sulfatase n=1 Tax=Halomontanus rarus TaxID=3034020 RepID=UPI0023E7C047|nr:sulfatase [Halovivax sp. TS33]